MHRRGITEDVLIDKVEFISKELIKRGAKIGAVVDRSGAMIAVRNGVNLLDKIIIKSKKDVFELSIKAKLDYKNVLLLSYYKNGLMHMFF